MSKWGLISDYLPSVKQKIRNRNSIKTTHINNIQSIENDREIKTSFSSEEEESLGEFAGKKHFEVIEFSKNNGYSSQEGHFKIHGDDNKRAFKKKTKSTIRRIRIKNTLSFLLWLITFAIIVLLFGISSGVVCNLI